MKTLIKLTYYPKTLVMNRLSNGVSDLEKAYSVFKKSEQMFQRLAELLRLTSLI